MEMFKGLLNRAQRRHPETVPQILKDVIRIDLKPSGMPIVHTGTKDHLVTIDVLLRAVRVVAMTMQAQQEPKKGIEIVKAP